MPVGLPTFQSQAHLLQKLTLCVVFMASPLLADGNLPAGVGGISGSFATHFGQKLTPGPETNQAAIAFEPKLSIPLSITRTLDLGTLVSRPTDPLYNFTVPRTVAALSQNFPWLEGYETRAILSVNALDLDRWKLDGYRVRNSVALELSREWIPDFEVSLRVGPFVQWNEYRGRADGVELPAYGLSERLRLTWTPGEFVVDLRLLLNQSRGTQWRNEYTTSESLGYRILPSVTLGIAHELVSSAIDDSTGLARSLQVFNGRESWVSAKVELEI